MHFVINSTTGNNLVWPIVGVGFGLWIFYRGLRLYRKTLVVADTPTVPIRSMAMGLVQIRGKATGEGSFPSPVSGTPCYAFKVNVERWRNQGNNSGWSHYRTDVRGKRFYIEDETGRVLADPTGIEYDLPKNCRRTVGTGIIDTFSLSLEHDIDPPTVEAAMSADCAPVMRDDMDLLNYAEGAGGGFGSCRYRLTEYCVIPGFQYDVLGTCTANPNADGTGDRNLIMKGQNERTYLISSKSAAQLERGFRWKSVLMVWGGIALVGLSTVILLNEFGLW